MEKKFYTDNFEQLLKENADKFRMYPSKRVWHGIYNNLHPSRRWPSLAIWLLLISSMVFIGLANRNNVPAHGNEKNTGSTVTQSNDLIAQNSNTTNRQDNNGLQNDKLQNNSGRSNTNNITTSSRPDNKENNSQLIALHATAKGKPSSSNPATRIAAVDTDNFNEAGFSEETKTNYVEAISIINTEPVAGSEDIVISTTTNDLVDSETDAIKTEPVSDIKKASAETENKTLIAGNINNDKAWIEDYAFHNKPLLSKWKTRVSYEVYFTPSVGYRLLSKNTTLNPSSSAIVATNGNEEDFEKALSQAAAINIELGGNFLYNISKNWNLKAGIQLNYTNYRVNAYELKHPTMTTLVLNDINSGYPILSPRSTTLANTSGLSSKKLNNNTYQLSIPLGADIRIAGKNNLKWFAGATIQPTLILGGNAYLISSDLKNYVTDKSLMRKMNLNAGVESFVSYKTKSGITINAGPQLRYQFFSTYNKQYTYNEKLYNLGLKIGIITKF